MNDDKHKINSYRFNIIEYAKQIQSIYRAGICFTAILSPITLIPFLAKIHLLFGGGSILFLILLCHYKQKTKMACNNLLYLAILNTLISITIILNFNRIHLWLCILTCLFAIYVSFDDEILKCLQTKNKQSDNSSYGV